MSVPTLRRLEVDLQTGWVDSAIALIRSIQAETVAFNDLPLYLMLLYRDSKIEVHRSSPPLPWEISS